MSLTGTTSKNANCRSYSATLSQALEWRVQNEHTNRRGGRRRRGHRRCVASESGAARTCTSADAGACWVRFPVLCRRPPRPVRSPRPCCPSLVILILVLLVFTLTHSQHQPWPSSDTASGRLLHVSRLDACMFMFAHTRPAVRQADVAVHDRRRPHVLPRRQGPGHGRQGYVAFPRPVTSRSRSSSSPSPSLLLYF
jgi:hypothetical protein